MERDPNRPPARPDMLELWCLVALGLLFFLSGALLATFGLPGGGGC